MDSEIHTGLRKEWMFSTAYEEKLIRSLMENLSGKQIPNFVAVQSSKCFPNPSLL